MDGRDEHGHDGKRGRAVFGLRLMADADNPWGIRFMAMFHMANDSGLFRSAAQLCGEGGELGDDRAWALPDGGRWLPLYEAKMIHHFDHRWATYDTSPRPSPASGRGGDPREASEGEAAGDAADLGGENEGGGGSRLSLAAEKTRPSYAVLPRYWVEEREVTARLAAKGWRHRWLMGWRDICRATDERTVIASALPLAGVGNKLPLLLSSAPINETPALYANLCSLVFDYVARQKVGGTTLNFFIAKQFPVLPPSAYSPADLAFIVPRVLELTYTAWDMQPFARDLGHDGAPFPWDPERRALLRAELDAYYAYLYHLTRDELRYILDPQDVKGADWPSETFRVLKKNEERAFGEYRTRRLVLAAFDRCHADGTFDLGRVEDVSYFPAMRSQLVATRAKLATTEQALAEARRLLARADADLRPTLFVEGETDVVILAAAWDVFHPGRPMPFKVLAAGGTMQLRSLAAPGKALRPILGQRLVMALADNDGEGRDLWRDGALHKGGLWRQQSNGVWWCLLPPSDAFRAAMAQLRIDAAFWPFTIENAFSPALRAEAAAAGAYALDSVPQSDFFADQGIAKRVLKALNEMAADDPVAFYLKAPAVSAKTAFAEWIAAPARRTAETYAAFAPVLAGLKDLLATHAAAEPPAQARLL